MASDKTTKTEESQIENKKSNGDPAENPTVNVETLESEEEVPATVSPPTPNIEDLKKEMLYLRADIENYKKRMVRQQDQSIRFANEKFISELLGIVHLFDMALPHAESFSSTEASPEIKTFVDGIQMTYREFTQLLSRFGVEFIGKVGEKFDPNVHEAVSQEESDAEAENTVLSVLQRGSRLHGRLIRPSKVVVSIKKSSSQQED